MDKLRQVIEEYPNWQSLTVYIDRIELFIERDFSSAQENAKALLESIAQEICKQFTVEVEKNISINKLLGKAFNCFDNTNKDILRKMSGSLATIGEQLGNIRNDIGITAHGKDLETIQARNDSIDKTEQEFLISSTVSVCVFLIRYYERHKPDSEIIVSLEYDQQQNFNDYLDSKYGFIEIGDYTYTASEVLYYVDYEAYKNEYISFDNVQIELSEDMKD